MVLGAHHALHALTGQAGAVVDVRAHAGGTDKADGLDVLVVADAVHDVNAAMHHVQHASGDAGFQRQFAQADGGHGILLGGLEHEGVAGGDGHGEHPQRNHGREVERGDAGAHAQRLQDGVGVDTASHVVGEFAHLQRADVGSVLDHFQAAEHVAFGVGQGLALFTRQDGSHFLDVFADQLLVLQENAGTGADGGVAPGLEGFLGGCNSGVQLFLGGHRHAGDDFLRGGVDDIAPFGGLGLDEFAVDQQRNLGDAHEGVSWTLGKKNLQECYSQLSQSFCGFLPSSRAFVCSCVGFHR